MIYASASNAVYHSAKALLDGSTSVLATKKVETSDPKEIGEAYLRDKLGFEQRNVDNVKSRSAEVPRETKPFAKPRGPGRR